MTTDYHQDDVRAPDERAGEAAHPESTEPAATRATGGQLLWRLGRSAAIYLVFGLVVAVLTEAVLEAARGGWQWGPLVDLAQAEAPVLALGTLVLLLVATALLGVTGQMWLTGAVMLSLATLLGVASDLKFVARREPIYPQDLVFVMQPRFLMEMVEPRLLWLTLLGLLPVIAFSWGLGALFRRWLRRGSEQAPQRWRPTSWVSRLAVVGVAVALLSSLLHFNHADNPWRRAYDTAGAQWVPWNQARNYSTNGFVGGFLYNLDIPAMAKPAGYSRATMERIVAEYTADAARLDKTRSPRALDDVNVVSVLSESFSDPTRLKGVRLGEDPLPRTRKLMERLPHGRMLALKVGSGTSSMEFEALTGMSLSQFNSGMDTPYQMLVPKFRTFPSAVEMFNRMGHTTLAIHPFRPNIYRRDRVYPILGFSDFVSQTEMDHHLKFENNPYISDGAAFRQVLDAIDGHEKPVFVNLVTMQNHTPYAGKYEDPIPVQGLDKDDAEMLGQYSRGLTYTDRAIAGFVRALEHSDEKTVVVLYGDHLPAGTPGTLWEDNTDRAMHETPFFIYANFGKVKPEELSTTSPIFFLPEVFDLAGAPLPPYYMLLHELHRHVPAMEHGRIVDADNRVVTREELSPRARHLLDDYRLVQYDLSVGKRYAEKMFYPVSTATVAASGAAE